MLVSGTFLSALFAGVWLGRVSLWILAAYCTLSLLTVVAYAVDKVAARAGASRISEATLHLFALVGGWPGAFVARHWLRHKTLKQPFRTVFAVTVVANCAAFVWLFTPDGASAQDHLEQWILATLTQL